ncbi:hypothetical protein BYT27DRAFT_7226673 [Phlegmacium glaucopus]|nr:hypothetical protein BYT27DRAFT_7226673 [Phlegmacium glaucopus]
MPRSFKANHELPAHQPPVNEGDILVDIEDNAQEQGLQGQDHLPNPEKAAKEKITYHPLINGLPCDTQGNFLPEGAPPPPWEEHPDNNFATFNNSAAFELADLLFRRDQMSGTHINDLLQIWASTLSEDQDPPFLSKNEMYNIIDDLDLGDAPWNSFTVMYNGEIQEGKTTPWKHKSFEVWYRDPRLVLHNQLGNREYANEMDFAPKDDEIANDPTNHGSMFCPTVLRSDKTTVSVGTGNNEYHPLYISNGLVHNNVCRAHRNTVTLLAFLSILKTEKEHEQSAEFRKFRHNLFHGSINQILHPLQQYMETPDIVRYSDGYYQRTIYGIGPYIADYPEQVLLACIVQGWCPRCDAKWDNLDDNIAGRCSHRLTCSLIEALDKKTLWDDYGIISDIMPFTHGFPRANIHELLSPDLLHQIIKGTFKDHLVTWVTAYINLEHSPAEAKQILADIDRRIAAAPSFPGLRHFPEGRGFKQWMGDDSKALMKVYLPAIAGHVPPQMVRVVSSLMEFCYLVRRNVINEDDILAINNAVAKFHVERSIFDDVHPDGYSLPHQHSLVHYTYLIQEFGAPNGLCSLITESKHIKAVKEPWRQSSHYKALGQMLVTNQCLDKLAAARVNFEARGMLHQQTGPPELPPPDPPANNPEDDKEDDGGAVDGDINSEVILAQLPIQNLPLTVEALGVHLDIPHLPNLVRRFLHEQLVQVDADIELDDVPLSDCLVLTNTAKIRVFPSTVAIYYAPSDLSGTRGMFCECIQAVDSWHRGPARHDCVFVQHDPEQPGFRGLYVAWVRHFFSIRHNKVHFPCVLVSWYSTIGTTPCADTGMWKVQPDFDKMGNLAMSIIHLDSMVRGAHLMGVAGTT